MLIKLTNLIKKNYLLVLVILLAAMLRFTVISKVPPSLNWDEVSHGYNAYSILKTGRDEWGQLFPLVNFRAYGDYPLPLNLYITIPFISILGLTELAVRLPHVIFGVLTVLASYFLALGVTKNEKIGHIFALLVAITPWYLFTSRFVVQSNLSIFFLTVSAAAFFNRNKHKYLLPVSFFSLGLTLFSYHTTRIFSPLFLIGLFVIYKKEILKSFGLERRVKIVSLFFILVFFLPLPFILAKPEARARTKQVFLIDEGSVNKIVEKRLSSKLPLLATKLFYNRPTYFVYEFIKNYFGYFSPIFLFLEGGTQYQFSIPGRGLLYLVNLPFFYIGLLILIRKALSNKNDYKFLLVWIIISPIPASVTKENFAVLRATTMLPLPEFITTLGIFTTWYWLLAKIKTNKSIFKIIAPTIFILFLFAGVEDYLNDYFKNYPRQYSQVWQYGYKEAVEYVKKNYSKYDRIIVTKKYGEPHEFFLFFWPWDPEVYRTVPNLNRFYQSNWYWVDGFDKFYFVNDWEIPVLYDEDFVLESGGSIQCSVDGGRCLLVTSPGNVPDGWNKLETINFLDGQPAFEIYENL